MPFTHAFHPAMKNSSLFLLLSLIVVSFLFLLSRKGVYFILLIRFGVDGRWRVNGFGWR